MLVVTIRPRQHIMIGEDIKIFNPNPEPMRIAIEAPRELQIVRSNAKDKTPKP